MKPRPRHLLALALPLALLAAGCSTQNTKPSASTGTSETSQPVAHESTSSTSNHPTASTQKLPEKTGIPACDDYLASYKGCHRAAGIYSPDTIDKHYREMRDTLVSESRDPSKRSELAARCVSLAKLLKQALHGKSCEPAQPASAASSQ